MAAKIQEQEHLRVYIRGYVREYVDGEDLNDSGFADDDGGTTLKFESPNLRVRTTSHAASPPKSPASPTSSLKHKLSAAVKELEEKV